jgi:predicted esterase
MRPAIQLIYLAASLAGCIELDFLFFEPETVESIEKDYHGLPLTLAATPPDWMASAVVEREIYVDSATGRALTEAEREDKEDFLHGAFLHAPQDCPEEECPLVGRDITFVYQPGNSGHLFRYWYRAVLLWRMGANVFIYTYRGYGLSRGEAGRRSILDDAEKAVTYVRGRGDVNPNRIIAYGYSMGGIPTGYLLGRSDHKGTFFAAVLESALDSPDDTLNLSAGTEFPAGFFMDDTPFRGPDFLKDAPELPVLQIHGGKDERVTRKQGEQYYEVLKEWRGYTHYLGKSDRPDEDWLAEANHRNVPVASFKGKFHIADYFDDEENPSHCCIHPIEYQDPRHAVFLDDIGDTTGQQMVGDAENYHHLVSGWVLSVSR